MTTNLQEWAARADPYHEVGLMPAHQAGGSHLPSTSHTGNDQGAKPWHPDSPTFWLVGVLGLTLLGVIGVSAGGRVGPVRAGASLGKP